MLVDSSFSPRHMSSQQKELPKFIFTFCSSWIHFFYRSTEIVHIGTQFYKKLNPSTVAKNKLSQKWQNKRFAAGPWKDKTETPSWISKLELQYLCMHMTEGEGDGRQRLSVRCCFFCCKEMEKEQNQESGTERKYTKREWKRQKVKFLLVCV